MCMNADAVKELGKVEEVESDDNGECIGKYARAIILVDITKPLKKIIFLEQDEENKIPILVLYERLLDFCYCYGKLGHQFRECVKYKGQRKEDLTFGYWLKAIILPDRFRQNMNQERGNQYRGKKAGESMSQEHHEQPSNTQEETGAELTQEKNYGSNKPIEIGHVVEEGIE